MQTLTQLADAARAVIAADRDGELTDDMINALEEALNGAELSPATEQSVEAASVEDQAVYDSIAANYHQQPAPAVPDALAKRCYVMSERHFSGYRLIIGFNSLDDAQAAHEALVTAPQPAQQSKITDDELLEAFWSHVEVQLTGTIRGLVDGLRAVEKLTAPQPAQQLPSQQLPSVIEEIAAERRRQIEVEGWTPGHDDQHRDYALAAAAGCYAMHTLAFPAGDPPQPWPWDKAWWKPSPDKRRNWIKAAALLVAAIEREDRMAAQKEGGE